VGEGSADQRRSLAVRIGQLGREGWRIWKGRE
jgi:hypothetical protein